MTENERLIIDALKSMVDVLEKLRDDDMRMNALISLALTAIPKWCPSDPVAGMHRMTQIIADRLPSVLSRNAAADQADRMRH